MPWKRPTGRTTAIAAITFTVGLAAGAAGVAAVASRASRAYLATAQLMLRRAEEQRASEAWRAGDIEAATGHAFCALEVQHGAGAEQGFSQDALPWKPFHLALLQGIIIEPNEPAARKAQPLEEAAARAQLAVAWERLGRVDAANREYAKAASLCCGKMEVEKLRSWGLQEMDLWSKVQGETRSPSAQPGDVAQPTH